jgi:hypothetical protein
VAKVVVVVLAVATKAERLEEAGLAGQAAGLLVEARARVARARVAL